MDNCQMVSNEIYFGNYNVTKAWLSTFISARKQSPCQCKHSGQYGSVIKGLASEPEDPGSSPETTNFPTNIIII